MARTLTYGGAISLDGFLAGPDGSIDWLIFSPDVQAVMAAYWKGVDTILMGRKTWAFAAAQSPARPKPARRPPADRRPSKPPKMHTYVFSRTLESIDAAGVELVREDAAGFVRRLKSQPGGRMCLMGGGELATSLLAAGLVDEVGLNIHPILLGSGVPVFRDAGRRVALTLTECRQLAGGCVLASYRVSA
ncbi:MAG TPA: dihydrofolate reductase family protein [Vicinamibacterales bacterium]|nr:dihydrofolate reductase family protein [Vicinamibacterales bacterium]